MKGVGGFTWAAVDPPLIPLSHSICKCRSALQYSSQAHQQQQEEEEKRGTMTHSSSGHVQTHDPEGLTQPLSHHHDDDHGDDEHVHYSHRAPWVSEACTTC